MYLNRYCYLLIIKRTGFVKPNVEFCAAVYYGKLKQTIPSFNEERKASSPRGRAARTSRTETLSITQIGHRSLRAAAARAPRRVGSSRAQLAECSPRPKGPSPQSETLRKCHSSKFPRRLSGLGRVAIPMQGYNYI